MDKLGRERTHRTCFFDSGSLPNGSQQQNARHRDHDDPHEVEWHGKSGPVEQSMEHNGSY
jgi:hypothetical protein